MSLYPIQPSFAGGELSPSLWGRIDLSKYNIGLRRLENFIVHPHGGVSRRPGTHFIAQSTDTDKSRLVTFQFSTEQAYVLEFINEGVRFYTNGQQIKNDDGTPYTVELPYTSDELSALNFAQSADVLFIVHPNHSPMELARYAENDWRASTFDFKYGPFKTPDSSQNNIKIGASATMGNVTITASADLFQTGHVGSVWSITHYVEQNVQKMTSSSQSGMSATAYKGWHVDTAGFWAGTVQLQRYSEDEGRWITMKTYVSAESAHSSKNYSDSGEFDEPTQIRLITSNFRSFVPTDNTDNDRGYFLLTADATDHTGYFKITGYTDAKTVSATIQKALASTTATVNWQEGAWSDVNGYPQTVGFYQERMCFAATKKEPQTLWFSKTGDYYNFGTSSPVVDDDAITITLASRQVNTIQHLISLESLIVLTSGAEWRIDGGSGSALTPTSISARPQGYRGSAHIEPIIIGNMILFVQALGNRVRDLGYSFESDSYTGNDLTIMAYHILEGHTIKSWAYQQEPDSICWIALDDGSLVSLTYLREHEVVAWARHPTDGTIESIASIQTSNTSEVYFVTTRHGIRMVEYMQNEKIVSPEDAYFVDAGITVTGTDLSEISGLDHLEGQTVKVLADGSVQLDKTVTDGKITLDYPASIVSVGLGYESLLETLDLTVSRNDGAQLGRLARVAALTVRVQNTRGLWAGTDEDHLLEQFDRTNEDYGTPTVLATTDYKLSLDSRYDQGRVVCAVKEPLPASIVALIPEVDLGE